MVETLSAAIAAVRSLATYLFVIGYTAAVGPPGLLLAALFKWPGILYRLGGWGVRAALALAGIRWRATGVEHIQPGRAGVYCVNHTSNVEPPILYLVLEALFPRLRILYKAGLRALPVLGRAFDIAGFVPIDRGNREQSAWAIETAALALRDGNSFLIFPEGTRSRTGALLPFKKGGFIIAIKAQTPIVPVAILGAREAMRKGSPIIRPVDVRVRVASPIETAGLTLADRDRLIAQARSEIQRLLDEHEE